MVHRDNGRASIGMTELLVTAPLAHATNPARPKAVATCCPDRIGIRGLMVAAARLSPGPKSPSGPYPQSTIRRLPEDYREPGPTTLLDSPRPLLNIERRTTVPRA